jgi:glutathione synthase/RimK-type ligase-like ATP-grasp enzyme
VAGETASCTSPPARVVVVGSARNETNCRLVEEWCALGIDAVGVPGGGLGELVRPDDLVLGRIDVLPTVDGVEPGLLALLRLGGRVRRTLNRASALAAAHDKALTARLLRRAGVAHPRTALLLPGAAPPPFEPPLVVKPRLGSWGVDVCRCDTIDERDRVLAALAGRPWFRRRGAVVQELIPPVGHDLRLLVADGLVVGATSRVPPPGEWRTNVALGADRVPAVPDAAACALAVAATAAIGADLVGVDLLPVGGGHVVLELNGAADFDEAYDLGGTSVFAEAARALGLLPGAEATAGVSPFAPALS